MSRNLIVSTAIELALVVGLTGGGHFARANAADGSVGSAPNGNQGSPVGAGASEQNRSGGQFSAGGAPTKNQATTQPSVPPNGEAAMQNNRSGGDFGPGGAPTAGQAETVPSGHGSEDNTMPRKRK